MDFFDEFFVWRAVRVYARVLSSEDYGFTADDKIDETIVKDAVIAGLIVDKERYSFKTIQQTTTAATRLLHNDNVRRKLFEDATRDSET